MGALAANPYDSPNKQDYGAMAGIHAKERITGEASHIGNLVKGKLTNKKGTRERPNKDPNGSVTATQDKSAQDNAPQQDRATQDKAGRPPGGAPVANPN